MTDDRYDSVLKTLRKLLVLIRYLVTRYILLQSLRYRTKPVTCHPVEVVWA